MNQFYKANKKIQWSIGIIMMLMLLACIAVWFLIDSQLLKVSIVFIMVPLYLFLSTPIMTLTKKYNYVSPMLMYIEKKDGTLELHNGTSFDYLFVMKNIRPGIDWRNKILQYYLDGLKEIVDKIKNGEISETSNIKGTSYFLGNSITKRLGFRISEPEVMDKINFFIDYLDLVWMFSLSKGKIQFPKFGNLRKAEISSIKLMNSENKLNEYKEYFKNKACG